MRLVLLDETDKSIAEYSPEVFKELLIKYFEVHKDIIKAFDQLSQDLIDKVKNR